MNSINTKPVRLAYTNSVATENNYSMMISLNKSGYTINVVHNCCIAAKLRTDESEDLQPVLQLFIGARKKKFKIYFKTHRLKLVYVIELLEK